MITVVIVEFGQSMESLGLFKVVSEFHGRIKEHKGRFFFGSGIFVGTRSLVVVVGCRAVLACTSSRLGPATSSILAFGAGSRSVVVTTCGRRVNNGLWLMMRRMRWWNGSDHIGNPWYHGCWIETRCCCRCCCHASGHDWRDGIRTAASRSSRSRVCIGVVLIVGCHCGNAGRAQITGQIDSGGQGIEGQWQQRGTIQGSSHVVGGRQCCCRRNLWIMGSSIAAAGYV